MPLRRTRFNAQANLPKTDSKTEANKKQEKDVEKVLTARKVIHKVLEPSSTDQDSKAESSLLRKIRHPRLMAKKPKIIPKSHTNSSTTRLVAGQDILPKKQVEFQGREIMQVVEDLLHQANILKERLLNMVNYFQETLCACENLAKKSSSNIPSKSCSRITAGSVAPSVTNDHYKPHDSFQSIVEETNQELRKASLQPSRISGVSRKSARPPSIGPGRSISGLAQSLDKNNSIHSKHTSLNAQSGTSPIQSMPSPRPEIVAPVVKTQHESRHEAGASFSAASERSAKRTSNLGLDDGILQTPTNHVPIPQEPSFDGKNNRPYVSPDFEAKLQLIQQEIQHLHRQMAMCGGCPGTTRYCDHATMFSHTLSGQLLGKANEIKDLLTSLKSDYYQQASLASEDLPDMGQQTVTQKCEKEIRRVNPEYTRTVNQTQNIEAEKNRTGDTQTANIMHDFETKIRSKYKDDDVSENVVLQTKVEETEKLKRIGPGEKQRETKTLMEKTVKGPEESFKEVSTVNEDDVLRNDARVITTTKKVVRTKIVEGNEPKEEVVTNITIRRVIDNKTGSVKETIEDAMTDADPEKPARRNLAGREEESFSQSVEKPIKDQSENNSLAPRKQRECYDVKKESLTSKKASIVAPLESEVSTSDGFSQESMSQFISKRSYVDDTPAVKPKRVHQPAEKSDSSVSLQAKEVTAQNNEEEEPVRVPAGGAGVKSTCSKVRYTLPNSEVPGVSYIGCEESDMSKYPGHRSKISANQRLVLDSFMSKKSVGTNTKESHLTTKTIEPELSPEVIYAAENETKSVTGSSYHAGAGGEPEVKSDSIIVDTTEKVGTQPMPSTFHSISSKIQKPHFRERRSDLNRSLGGTSIEIPGMHKEYQKPFSSQGFDAAGYSAPPPSESESIADIIRKFSGSRSPNEFFVSILPEIVEVKKFRINIIDKETGNLLGNFFINEEEFKKARDDGVFDKYLSLFVLNSIGSFDDYVDLEKHLNTKHLKPLSCSGKCHCKEEAN